MIIGVKEKFVKKEQAGIVLRKSKMSVGEEYPLYHRETPVKFERYPIIEAALYLDLTEMKGCQFDMGDGKYVSVRLISTFRHSVFRQLMENPSVFYFDKNGLLHGEWEINSFNTFYHPDPRGGRHIPVNELSIHPCPNAFGNYTDEYQEESFEEWFMREYDLEKILV